MTPEELTQIVTAHQSAISRHDQEITSIRVTLQESANQHKAHVAKMEALQAFNQEQLNQFTAGMLELRGLVADYLRGRSETK